jgi:hypothetical protein
MKYLAAIAAVVFGCGTAHAIPAPATSGAELQDQELISNDAERGMLERGAVDGSAVERSAIERDAAAEEFSGAGDRHEATSDLLSRDARARYRPPPVLSNEHLANGEIPTASIGRALPASRLASVQRALRARGYDVSVSGVYDDRTTGALKQLQRSNFLRQSGKADAETLAVLGLE